MTAAVRWSKTTSTTQQQQQQQQQTNDKSTNIRMGKADMQKER